MLLKKKNKNIIKNIINRKKNKLIQNNLTKIIKRCYVIQTSNRILNSTKLLKKNKKKICLNTGRYSSVNPKLNFTRQQINKLFTLNKIDNYNVASW